MTVPRKCPECGAKIPSGAPDGLCPNCLLGRATGALGETEPIDSCASATMADAPSLEEPGTIIGHYKLLQKIGEGGMGVVYMAEQTEPVRRTVALKIVKLGMDTKEVVSRFNAERQALALMDHPNIARVLDAGAAATGRPYFVMELVRGIPITEYCDKNRLDFRARLELFIPLCHALQHAHQKAIIHRDLKPTNVMVTLHDGRPVPKVIDFGVAKATNQRLTEQTLFTQYGQFIGTPEYMSPEQAEMSGLDVDTRADIYSLGVLLFELLTGTTPFDPRRLREAGYEEMRRILCEEDPRRPSTAISTLDMRLQTSIAAHRHIELTRLRQAIRGDLDWIIMKALEKDRTRRYETAEAFALDVEHYLNDEPVRARPPSVVYHIRKFLHKHRGLVCVAATILLLLVVGSITSLALFIRGQEALRLATANEQKALQAEGIARDSTRQAMRHLYAADLALAHKSWREGRHPRTAQLLERHRPRPGEEDLRSWEWYYLKSLLHQDLRTFTEGDAPVHAVAWNPPGTQVAVAGGDGVVRIWDPYTGKILLRIRGHEGAVRTLSWSQPAGRLATGGDDHSVRAWDPESGEEVLALQGHEGAVLAVAWSPGGEWLASASADGTVRIWDATGREVRHTLTPGLGPVNAVAWSPSGQCLVTGHGTRDWGYPPKPSLVLWDAANGREMDRKRTRHPPGIAALAWRPGSKHDLVVAQWSTRFLLWRARPEAGALGAGWAWHDPSGSLSSVAWSPDGSRYATAGDSRLIQVRPRGEGPPGLSPVVSLAGHLAAINALAWSPDGRHLVSGSATGQLKLWDTNVESDLITRRNETRFTPSLGWAPRQSHLLVLTVPNQARPTQIWDGKTSRLLESFPGTLPGKSSCAAWSPDGTRVATVSGDGKIRILDAKSGSVLTELLGGAAGWLTWSPGGDRLAALARLVETEQGDRLRVVAWDVASGEIVLSSDSIDANARTIDWSSAGLLAAPGEGRDVRIWDMRAGRELPPFSSMGKRTKVVAWSHDGTQLAAGGHGGHLMVWEADGGKPTLTVQPHTMFVNHIAWSPDDQRVATTSFDGTVKLHEPRTGAELLSFKAGDISEHQNADWCIAWSPDGQRFAMSGEGLLIADASRGYALESDTTP